MEKCKKCSVDCPVICENCEIYSQWIADIQEHINSLQKKCKELKENFIYKGEKK